VAGAADGKAAALRQYYWAREERGRTIVRAFTAMQASDPSFPGQGWRRATLEDVVTAWRRDFVVHGRPGHRLVNPELPRPNHDGATAWILGSGPSLRDLDLRQLEGRLTFSINRAIRHPRHPSTASYIVACDDRVFEWEAARFVEQAEQGAGLITLGRWSRPAIEAFQRKWLVGPGGATAWSHDLALGYGTNSSTVFLALQFAAWAGCRRAVLLGVDLGHADDGRTHFFGRVPRNVAMDPQNLMSMRACFSLCEPEIRRAGMELVNCSPTRRVPGAVEMPFDHALELDDGFVEEAS
jgi:hypothetical protein